MSYCDKLPCKVGDTVYMVVNLCDLCECKIIEIDINFNNCIFIAEYGGHNRTELYLKNLGKNWFVNLKKRRKSE